MFVGKKVIKVQLSSSGIDDAIKELNAYEKDIQTKTKLLRKRVSERIAELSQSGFNGAKVDVLLDGMSNGADVGVRIEEGDNVTYVKANGDAVWVEFGAGVYFNGSVGSSPHPKGSQLGFTIGGFGKGRGKGKVWGFTDEEGELKLTHGTQATMPMYNATKIVYDEIVSIAREVFR